jgi:hypothetical protein
MGSNEKYLLSGFLLYRFYSMKKAYQYRSGKSDKINKDWRPVKPIKPKPICPFKNGYTGNGHIL